MFLGLVKEGFDILGVFGHRAQRHPVDVLAKTVRPDLIQHLKKMREVLGFYVYSEITGAL